MTPMIQLKNDNFVIDVDESKLTTLQLFANEEARNKLATIWDTEADDLSHYYALLGDKEQPLVSDNQTFMTVSLWEHGYVLDSAESVNLTEIQQQIEIDLEIINRESQWSAEESIYFGGWWPKPTLDKQNHVLDFGVSLKDFHQKAFNRTINRIILTRYGHILMNFSLSENDINANTPQSYFQEKFDEVTQAMGIQPGYRYEDVNEDTDMPSKSRMMNLILSSEIF